MLSILGEEGSSGDVRKTMAHQGGMLPVLIVIVVLIGVTLTVNMPVSPRITVTLAIERPQSWAPPKISFISSAYDRIPIGAALAAQRDTPILALVSGVSGTYVLTIEITYRQQKTASAGFPNIGTGTYQISVFHFPRAEENKDIPYVAKIALFEGTQRLQDLTVNIYPF